MFWWRRSIPRRASSLNIDMYIGSFAICGRTRLMATIAESPDSKEAWAFHTSAMPPTAMRLTGL